MSVTNFQVDEKEFTIAKGLGYQDNCSSSEPDEDQTNTPEQNQSDEDIQPNTGGDVSGGEEQEQEEEEEVNKSPGMAFEEDDPFIDNGVSHYVFHLFLTFFIFLLSEYYL
jgi:hypothetical protein